MKIIHFHHTLNIGGIDTLVCALVNNMAKEHDVSICTFLKLEKDEGMRPLLCNVKYFSLGNNSLSMINRILDMFKIYKFLARESYDIVQLHGAFPFYIIAVPLLKKKMQFFYTIHSDAYKENTPFENKILKIKKYYFKKGWMRPITISETSQKSFRDLYQCESTLIKNGIEEPYIDNEINPLLQFRYTKDTKLFVHAGRLCPAKNQIVLCQVFEKLISEGHDVVLLIIGPKDDMLIYEKLQPFFNERIIYLGPQTKIPIYFYYSDAMCMPSLYEGLPIALLESLSVGCAPICSPVGGIIDVIQNGVNGILSRSESLDDYYEAILKWITLSEHDKDRIRNNARLSFKKYNISTCVKTYLELYTENCL